MQNIIIICAIMIASLFADTVGVEAKRWVDAPVVPDDAYKVSEVDSIGEEVVIPSSTLKELPLATIQAQTPQASRVKNFQLLENVIDFFMPLVQFVKDFPLLFSLVLSTFTALLYFIFYRPLAMRVANYFDDEIDVSYARNISSHTEVANISSSMILTQEQYASLQGLIHESFLYEKERILLDKASSQEDQNRDIISLEWKSNQILHFSLPKLSTTDMNRFIEGAKELLEEETTRDIMMIALEDIMIEDSVTKEEKSMIESLMRTYAHKVSSEQGSLSRSLS